MRFATEYMTFQTKKRREFINITEDVRKVVKGSGMKEGMVLVSAMHITAGVWVNDAESGLHADVEEWLESLAPYGEYWHKTSKKDGPMEVEHREYRHHRSGEDNGDAHFKNLLVHHQVIVPITAGDLDLGPWQQIFYMEFDGMRRKRLVIKAMGE